MEERKEFDLFINLLNNQNASFDNFITSGMNVNNTSLLSKSEYENNNEIRKEFTDEQTGEFNKTEFDTFYNNAKIFYNYLAQADYNESIKRQATFHRSNVYADPEKRRKGPDFFESKVANPYHLTESVIQLGLYGDPTQSADEIMQGRHVLLNPTTAGDNLENAKWGGAPEENFWKYFTDVLVQAQWDEAGTHKDLMTGQEVHHEAGELKTDDTGNFYYELLDGRDVYNRRVLNKGNILTKEGSWLNDLDFFDSDNLKQKNPVGSIMRNVALIGSMFLPGVGPWIIGISIATQLAGLFGTLGKMATMDSSNSFFSYLEGWSKSVNRQNTGTQYVQEHPWCLENMINLAGDVFAQLKEQRFIFEKVPALFKGVSQINKTNVEVRKLEYINKQKKLLDNKLANLKARDASDVEVLKFQQAYNANLTSAAQAEMDSFIKGYNKLGEIFSRGYMTAITVGDTYGVAKNAGASDEEATFLTLGYALAEYQLLKTGLGRWNLPELRQDKFRNQAIARALYTAQKNPVTKGAAQEAKRKYASKLFNAGKKAFHDIWTAEKANGTTKASLINGLAEGVEEVSEEILADFSKACFNTIEWLRGDDTRINAFGYDYKKQEWNLDEVRDRYGLSLVGGMIGGGLASITTNYNIINEYKGLDRKSAVEQLVYIVRNNETDQFFKDINKLKLGDSNLSSNFEIIDNQAVFDPGTKTNNQDLDFKKVIHKQVDIIKNILDAHGAVSDNIFLDELTLSDLRYELLQHSTMAGAYIQEYNDLLTDILKTSTDLKALAVRDLDTNKDNVVQDSENQHNQVSDDTQKAIKKKKEELNKLKKSLDDLTNGNRSLEFAVTALWELTPFISQYYNKQTLPLFAEQKFGKPIDQLTEEEIKQAKEDFDQWKPSHARDDLRKMALTFLEFEKQFSSIIKQDADTYKNLSEETKKILEVVDKLNRVLLYQPDEQFVSNLQKTVEVGKDRISNASAIFASDIISILGNIDEQDALKDIKERRRNALKNLSENATQEDRDRVNLQFDQEQTQFVYNTFGSALSYFFDKITDVGFATKETKNQLLTLANDIQTQLLIPLRIEQENINERTGRDFNIWDNFIKDLTLSVKKLKTLPETPLEINLNKFAITIGRDPIIISQLIDKINTAFNETKDNVSMFNATDLLTEIDNSIFTMEMYHSAILAARTDNANFNNLFGFNATLNEIAKKTNQQLELAEIDKDTADIFIAELNTNLNKLRLLRKLHLLNRGQKLLQQNRVATNKDLLMYKRMKYFVQVLDDLDDIDEDSKEELKSIMQSQSLHEEHLNSHSLNVTDEETFQKENLAIENGVYNFFQKNKHLLTDVDKLSKLLNPSKLDIYTETNDILNEDTSSIDDNSFIYWLAAHSILRLSDFYYVYGDIINLDSDKPLAPIATQELAVYNNYANAINGNVFVTFVEAYKKALKDDWKNDNETDRDAVVAKRKEILKKLGKPEKFATDDYQDFVFSFLDIPIFTNVVLTEGIGGSGKTSAVFKLTYELLRKNHPELLENLIIAHGAQITDETDIKPADKLKDALGATDATTFDKEQLMKYISTDWVEYTKNPSGQYLIPNNHVTIDGEGQFRSTLSINKALHHVPKIMFIDEITNFTGLELDLLDKFAKYYGVTIFVAGEMDQSGITGRFEFTGGPYTQQPITISFSRNNFIRTPILGVSMRTDNTLKAINQLKFKSFMHNDEKQLVLDYTENEEGLFGDKVILYNDQLSNQGNDDIKNTIDNMIATLKTDENGVKQKIGYVYNNEDSPLYKYLSTKPEIQLYKGTSAQGLEGQYFIVELGYDLNTKNYLKNLYTGSTRSKQGTLILHSGDYAEVLNIKSEKKTEVVIKEPLGKESIKKFAANRKYIIQKVVTDGKVPEYVPRTQEDVVQTQQHRPSHLPQGSSDPDAALNAAIEAEKQAILDFINTAASENDINDRIRNSTYAQLGTDPDVIAAIQTRVQQIYDEAMQRQQKISQALSDINFTNTIDELDAVMARIDEDLKTDLQSAYDSQKAKIEQNIQQQTQQFITQLIADMEQCQTLVDLENIIRDATSRVATIMEDPLVQNAYAVIKEKLKQAEIVKSAATEAPFVEEDPHEDDLSDEEAAPDSLSQENYQAALDHDNASENEPKSKVELEQNPKQNEKPRKFINMLFHSSNTFELGVDVDEKGNIQQYGNPAVRKRIDSVNGLIKIDNLAGRPLKSIQEYIDILGDLRNIVFNTKEKADIERQIKRYFGFKNIYTTFALKGSYRKGPHLDTDEDGYSSMSPTPLEKSKYERTLFNKNKSNKINEKSLVLIIGTEENGDVLELPLLVLSSPFTLIQTKSGDGDYEFPEMYAVFEDLARRQNPNWKEDLKKTGDSGLDLSKISYALVEQFKNNKEYRSLVNLFKLFNVTSNFIKFIENRDWTPGRNLNLLGSYITSHQGYYDLQSKNTYDADEDGFINLADYAGKTPINRFVQGFNPFHNTQTYVSDIQIVGNNDIFNGIQVPISKGHPFVMVSFSNQFKTTDQMNDRYMEQLRDPSLPKLVIREYVRMPSATIEEYIDQIHDFIHNPDPINPKYMSIGYFSTYYKVLKGLTENPNNPYSKQVIELMQRKMPNTTPIILDLLKNGPALNASTSELKRFLNETRDTHETTGIGSGPVTINYMLRNVLDRLVYDKPLLSTQYTKDQNAVNILMDATKNLGINLYEHYSIPRNDHNSNKYFILVNPSKDYMINGKPVQLRGKSNSQQFSGIIDWFINDIINIFETPSTLPQFARGQSNQMKANYYRTPDNYKYNHGNSKIQKARSRNDQAINKVIEQVKTKAGLEINPDVFKNKPFKQALTDVANIINSTSGTSLAFVNNSNLYIINDPSFSGIKIIYNNGQPTVDIKKGIFNLSIDGKQYVGEFDFEKQTLSLVESIKRPSFEELVSNITPDNFENYINEFKLVAKELQLIEAEDPQDILDPDLAEVFSSNSYDIFIDKLNKLEHFEPDEDTEGSISFRIDLLESLKGESNETQKEIIDTLIKIEENKIKQDDCHPKILQF